MNNNIFNELSLAYSPLSAYDFATLKIDDYVHKAIEFSTLYIIAQRPVLYFNEITIDNKEWALNFEIHQKNNSEILNCKIPLDQEHLFSIVDNPISIKFWYTDEKYKTNEMVKNQVTGIQLFTGAMYSNFKIWFSPEKFLQNYNSGSIKAEVRGSIINFRKYNVLYVGKSTEQSIHKRLSSHSKLQEILSLENNINVGELTKDETVLLLFNVTPNLITRTYKDENDLKYIIPILEGKLPTRERITSDAEKALIKLMNPKYNGIKYKNYPKGRDGLYSDEYNHIVYSIKDDITLQYSNSYVKGGEDKSSIIVIDGKELIIKQKT